MPNRDDTETQLPAWRGAVANLTLLAVSVLLTLGLFEIGARVFASSWAPQHGVRNFWTQDPLLGWVHVPNQNAVHRHQDFEVRVATNAMGFRDDPTTVEPSGRRVLVLGDSFGFGYGVERDEGIVDRLEASFPGTEFVNASVAGYGTDQQLLFFREHGLALSPDVVLLLFHPNDIEDNNDDHRYRYHKPQFVLNSEGGLELTNVPVPPLTLRQRISRTLQQRTYVLFRVWDWRDQLGQLLDQWQRDRAEAAALADAPAAKPAKKRRNATVSPDVAAGSGQAAEPTQPSLPAEPTQPSVPAKPGRNQDFRVSRALIRLLAAEVEASGARFAVASIPGVPDPRELLTSTLSELGVPYLPLDAAFDGLRRREYKFEHDPHWNPLGHQLAAERAAAWLRREGVL